MTATNNGFYMSHAKPPQEQMEQVTDGTEVWIPTVLGRRWGEIINIEGYTITVKITDTRVTLGKKQRQFSITEMGIGFHTA